MPVALIQDVSERGTPPAQVLADDRPHRMNLKQNLLRLQQGEVEVGLDLSSDVSTAAHEEAVPDEVIIWEVMSTKRMARLPE